MGFSLDPLRSGGNKTLQLRVDPSWVPVRNFDCCPNLNIVGPRTNGLGGSRLRGAFIRTQSLDPASQKGIGGPVRRKIYGVFKMITGRRKVFSGLIGAGAVALLGAERSLAVQYQAVIPCSYCGTGFRVEWNGTETGYTSYQCPKCSKMSRVYWDSKGVQKVEKA